MTDNGTTATTQPEENPAVSRQQEPDIPERVQPTEPAEPAEPAQPPEPTEPAEDPGYLTRTGEAVGEDGSVVPIIGGLPAVEGSAWDIGAPVDDRGVDLADRQEIPPER
jgi:hypothetical protein